MKLRLVLVACLSAATAAGQSDGSFGMGISAPGADDGTRAGDPVDLRFYAGVSGTYRLQPYAVDTKGKLAVAKGLYGEEASLALMAFIRGSTPGWAWTTRAFSDTTLAATI